MHASQPHSVLPQPRAACSSASRRSTGQPSPAQPSPAQQLGAHDVADFLFPQPHVGVEDAVVELLLVRVDQLPHLQQADLSRTGE